MERGRNIMSQEFKAHMEAGEESQIFIECGCGSKVELKW